MYAQTPAASRNKPKPVNSEDVLNFREILGTYLYHWPLYILLIIVCGGAGFVYSKLVVPGYEIKASIVLSDDKDAKSSHKDVLDQLEVTDAPKIVENELQILKSRNLMSKVVYDLKLYCNHRQKPKEVLELSETLSNGQEARLLTFNYKIKMVNNMDSRIICCQL